MHYSPDTPSEGHTEQHLFQATRVRELGLDILELRVEIGPVECQALALPVCFLNTPRLPLKE